MKTYTRIRNGLLNLFTFCAMWVGVTFIFLLLINNETPIFFKIGMSVLIIVSFLFGYFEDKK
jgi:hypothetical protein